jgi:hypothetical protein
MTQVRVHTFVAVKRGKRSVRSDVQEYDIADVRPVFGKEAE